MALFALDEFETAKAAFEKGQQLEPSNSTFKTWLRKCDAELESEESESGTSSSSSSSSSSAPLSNTSTSSPSPSSSSTAPPTTTPTPSTPAVPPTSAASTAASSTATAKPSAAPTVEQQKIRHEWYQTNTHVFVTIFAKNVKKEDAKIELAEKSLCVTIKVSASSEYQLDVTLYDSIVPSESSISYLSTKLEIKMKKYNQVRWKTLEDAGEPIPAAMPATATASSTVSSKPKKNWDKIVEEETKDEKLEGEEALNKVFQDIYANGTDEQKRAMIKSFIESGGTVLSTNWEDVGKAPVKGSPPEGMEMHRWNED